MTADSQLQDDWTDLPTGRLSEFAAAQRKTERRRIVARRAVAGLALAVALGVWGWAATQWSGQRENFYGGIACSEVRANMQAYESGELPESLAARIRQHLAECPVCQELMREAMGQPQSAAHQPDAMDLAVVDSSRPTLPGRASARVDELLVGWALSSRFAADGGAGSAY